MAIRARWFLQELKRRRVYHVGVAYAVVAFVVWQVADIAIPALSLPESAVTLILLLTILGFPIALVLAWAYEVRPEGADEWPDASGSIVPESASGTEPSPAAVSETEPSSATTLASERTARVSGSGERSVAVLPFANLGPSPEGDYFSDGMTEEITHVLARSSELRVVARTSAFAFKHDSADIREVARRLGVAHLVEGSIRRAGDRLRVTVQLIEAESGMHLWSERYDREMDDVFTIQDQIAAHVADRLAGALGGGTELEGPLRETSLAAYDAYLRGRQVHARLDPSSYEVAIEQYRESISRDPEYAPARAALAQVLTFQSLGLGIPSADTMPIARDEADRALALAPTLADAHLARAMVAMYYEWDFERAKRGIDRALELRPNYAEAHMWAELYWTYVRRRYEEAVAATRRAQELDLLETSVRVRLGSVYYVFGRYDKAVEYLERLVVDEPDFALAHMALGDARLRAGDVEGSVEAARRTIELFGGTEGMPNASLGVVGTIFGLAGDRAGGEQMGKVLAARGRSGSVTAFWEGVVRAALDDFDDAFGRFEAALQKRDAGLLFLTATPRALGLRADPRFAELLRSVGLSPEDES